MKKIVRYITAAILLLCLLCTAAISALAYTEGYFRYEITDGNDEDEIEEEIGEGGMEEDGSIAEPGDNAPAPENSPEAPAEKPQNNNTLLYVIIYAIAVIAVAAVGIIVFVKRKK